MNSEYNQLLNDLERANQEFSSVSYELHALKQEKNSVKDQVEVLKEAKDAVRNGIETMLRDQEMSPSVRTRRRIRHEQAYDTFQKEQPTF